MKEEEKNLLNEDPADAPDAGAPAEKPKEPIGKRIIGSLYDIVEMLGVITVAIILCFSFIVRLNVVDGPSMENTLQTGQYLVVSDLFYTPTRGDVIVLQNPIAEDRYRKPLVKRIIATEGQYLEIDVRTGDVTVDGQPVDETEYRNLPGEPRNYFGEHMEIKGDKATITVPEGYVFVMGDNRNNSADSRLDGIGPVDARCIVGKVYARVWPLDKFSLFQNPLTGN